MAAATLKELTDALEAELFFDSLEELVTSKEGFGLTNATPLQRAICWVLQNNTIPDHLWKDPIVQEAFGGVRPQCSSDPVREVLILAGIRGGKTLICAAACLWFAITVDLSKGVGEYMLPGEVPRVSLVSALVRNARAAFRYLKGALTERPRLKPLLLGEPVLERISVRHPSGRQVDICIVAMSGKQGVNLVSDWSAGVLFDEAPRISSDEADGKVNLEGMVTGVQGRVLPGCAIMYVGSPVGAIGYCYKLFSNNFGVEGASVTVCKAKGWWLNPVHWTPERRASMALNPRTQDAFRCDGEAEFIDVETAMFSAKCVSDCTRSAPMALPPEEGRVYSAVLDPASRNNACTLLVGTTDDNVRFKVALAIQWQGSRGKPLDFNEIIPEVKKAIEPYGVRSVLSDQWAIDPIRALAVHFGLGISSLAFTAQNKTKLYKALQMRINSGLVELPPVEDLRNDLIRVRLIIKSNGDPVVKLVETEDGRHCDFAAGLALLCGGHLEESDIEKYNAEKQQLTEELEDQAAQFLPLATREWEGHDDVGEQGAGW